MKNLTVKTWLTIAALFLSTAVSFADCSSNANQCTPKQLCEKAIYYIEVPKVWKVAWKHVIEATRRGLTCGVNERSVKSKTCSNKDLKNCVDSKICYNARTPLVGLGPYTWKTNPKYNKYVLEGKSRGLSCGVTEGVREWTCSEGFKICKNDFLCQIVTHV